MRRSSAEGASKRGVLLCIGALLLWGCSTPSTPPVVDRSVSEIPRDAIHEVRAGETLYAIAFRYSLDFRELADINDIEEPYVIRVGESLRLRAGARLGLRHDAGAAPRDAPARRRTPPQRAVGGLPKSAELKWIWPAMGNVVTRFGAESKGIDVDGKVGDPVRAAAAGEVVYAGSGLRGYGNLVIIKHDERTLSAYGHNRTLLVKEGEQVRGGQAVARMGLRGTRSLVHFEIRRDGKPLDPVSLLPSR